jgi:hypothetical protein
MLKETKDIIKQSEQAPGRFDTLLRTGKGMVQPWKLHKGERKHLNRVAQESPDSIGKFLE